MDEELGQWYIQPEEIDIKVFHEEAEMAGIEHGTVVNVTKKREVEKITFSLS